MFGGYRVPTYQGIILTRVYPWYNNTKQNENRKPIYAYKTINVMYGLLKPKNPRFKKNAKSSMTSCLRTERNFLLKLFSPQKNSAEQTENYS